MRFAAVGVFGTTAHYAVLALLVELGGAPILVATTAGFVAGAIVNYLLNRKVTFRSAESHSIAFPKFLTVATLGAGLNFAVVALLTYGAGVHYFMAQIVATAAVLVWNFAGNHLWTFRQ